MDKPALEDPVMKARDLCRCLDLFEELGITVWLGGGWGVDALFSRGFEDVETDGRTVWNFVMGDTRGIGSTFMWGSSTTEEGGMHGPPERGVSSPE